MIKNKKICKIIPCCCWRGFVVKVQKLPLIKYSIVGLLFLFSCSSENKNKQTVEHYLTNGKEKYWALVRTYPTTRVDGVLYRSDGTCISWYNGYSNCIITDTRIINDYIEDDRWRLIGDSILNEYSIDEPYTVFLEEEADFDPSIRHINPGTNYKIEYINDSILILNNMSIKQISVYKKSKDQHTKPIRDTREDLLLEM